MYVSGIVMADRELFANLFYAKSNVLATGDPSAPSSASYLNIRVYWLLNAETMKGSCCCRRK